MWSRTSAEASQHSNVDSGPPASWWWSHAIAALVVSGAMLIWGVMTLTAGHSLPAFLPRHYHRAYGLQFEGTAARLFGVALVVGSPGAFAHMFLTCFDRLKWAAGSFAKLTGVVFLLLVISAVFKRLIG